MSTDTALDQRLTTLLAADQPRMAALRAVAALGLPDGWIGAGFIRNAVWDMLHDIKPRLHFDDVDVVWFDPARTDPAWDAALAARLPPGLKWSVTNQARMHARHGHAPYRDTADAIRHWPETATAVAARLQHDRLEVLAPHGLDDLFAGLLRPSPGRDAAFARRIAAKPWLRDWPGLRISGTGC